MLKVNKMFFISILFPFISFAEVGFEKPGYCEKYDGIYSYSDGRVVNKSEVVYEHGRFKIQMGELASPIYDDYAKDWYLISQEKRLRRRVLSEGLRQLGSSANQYAGIAGFTSQLSTGKKFNKCMEGRGLPVANYLKEDLSKQIKLNEDSLKRFLTTNMAEAVMLSALMEYFKTYRAEYDAEKREISSCYLNYPATESGMQEAMSACGGVIEDLKKAQIKYKEGTENQMAIFDQMIKKNHLLVTLENSFSLTDWNNNKIVLSPLAKTLVNHASKEMMADVVKALSGHRKFHEIQLDLNDVRRKHKEAIFNSYSKISNDGSLKSAVRREYIRYLEDVYSVALAQCENNGEYLHYHSQIIDAFAQRINNRRGAYRNKSDYENTKSMISLQAHQCKRWREAPYESSSKWSAGKTVGLLLAGGGVAMSLVPFAGPVLTAVTVSAGAGLMTYKNIQDYQVSEINLVQEKQAYFSSWKDLRSIGAEMDRQNDLYFDIATEAVLAAVSGGAFALGKAKHLKRITETPYMKYSKGTRHTENMNARGVGSSSERVDKLNDLIKKRYADTPAKVDDMDSWFFNIADKMRNWTGNHDIPAFLTVRVSRQKSYAETLVDLRKDPLSSEFKEAVEEVMKVAAGYANHIDTHRDLVRLGEEARVQGLWIKDYLEAIKKAGGRVEDFDDGVLSLRKTPFGFEVKLPKIKYDEAGKAHQVDEYIPMQDVSNLKGTGLEADELYQRSFTQNLAEEAVDSSLVSAEINMQPWRRAFLIAAQRLMLKGSSGLKHGEQSVVFQGVDVGKEVILHGSKTDPTNEAFTVVNWLLKNTDLYPRADAFDTLRRLDTVSEVKDFFSLKKRLMATKLGGYLAGLAERNAVAGFLLRYAVLAPSVTAVGTGSLAVLSSYNQNAYYAYNNLKEARRALERQIRHRSATAAGRDFPHPFTKEEYECFTTNRKWTIGDGSCFDALVKKEIWRELYELRWNDDISFDDESEFMIQLVRKVRDYEMKFLENREADTLHKLYGLGKQTLSDTSRDVSKIRAVKSLDAMLQSEGLTGEYKDILRALKRGVIEGVSAAEIDDLTARIDSAKGAEELIQALSAVLKLIEKGFPEAIQNPGTPQEFKDLLKVLSHD